MRFLLSIFQVLILSLFLLISSVILAFLSVILSPVFLFKLLLANIFNFFLRFALFLLRLCVFRFVFFCIFGLLCSFLLLLLPFFVMVSVIFLLLCLIFYPLLLKLRWCLSLPIILKKLRPLLFPIVIGLVRFVGLSSGLVYDFEYAILLVFAYFLGFEVSLYLCLMCELDILLLLIFLVTVLLLKMFSQSAHNKNINQLKLFSHLRLFRVLGDLNYSGLFTSPTLFSSILRSSFRSWITLALLD